MFDSIRNADAAKKTWSTPSVGEFKIEEVTQAGGPDTFDGLGGPSLAAS